MRKNMRFLALGLLGSLFSQFAFALEGSDPLEEALISAYHTNPQLKAERAKLHAIDEQLSEANAHWRPRLRIEGEVGARRSNQKAPLGAAVQQSQITSSSGKTTGGDSSLSQSMLPRGGKLVAEQPLYQGGRIAEQKKAVYHGILAQRHLLLSVEQEVFLDVILAHLDVVTSQSILDLQKKTEQVLERHLEATKARLDVGELTRTDLSQAEFRLAGAKAERIKAESDLKNAKSAYEKVVGYEPAQLNLPKKKPQLPASLDACLEIAEAENPFILAAREDESSSRHDVNRIKGELLPSVSLRGELTQAHDQMVKRLRNRDAGLYASISIPLYSSGSVEARIRQALHTQNQKGHNIEQARREVREKTFQFWDILRAAKAQIIARKHEVSASEVALEGVVNENKVGARTVIEVLDAEKDALKAKVNLVQAERDELAACYALLPALGRLHAKALGLHTNLFDPKVHLEKVRGKWFGWSEEEIKTRY